MQKIKILFVLENLSGGGAEKVLVNLVNNMSSARFDITVMTLFDDGHNSRLLGDSVRYISLKRKKIKGIRLLTKFLPKRLLYRYYINDDSYDVTVAFMTGVPTFVVSGSKAKKIAWLHGEFFAGRKIYNLGLKSVYKKFDAVAGVSDYVCESFRNAIDPAINPVTVYNTNDVSNIISLAEEDCALPFSNDAPVICSVGRTVKEKGFDRLIDVAVKLRGEGTALNLLIVGHGDRYKDLAAKVKENGAEDYIYLPGYDTNPYKYLAKSDMFVCSSFTEGLSTALTEAVILGLPCVSTDVPGAKEVLGENGEYGIVTGKTDDELYNGIKALLSDESLREHYADKAEERSAFFNTENTVKQAEELFRSVLY